MTAIAGYLPAADAVRPMPRPIGLGAPIPDRERERHFVESKASRQGVRSGPKRPGVPRRYPAPQVGDPIGDDFVVSAVLPRDVKHGSVERVEIRCRLCDEPVRRVQVCTIRNQPPKCCRKHPQRRNHWRNP